MSWTKRPTCSSSNKKQGVSLRKETLLCTGREARTPDTRFWRPMLYQLSYSRVCGCKGSIIFQSCKHSAGIFAGQIIPTNLSR